MHVFRELFLRGEPDLLSATIEAICNSLSGDWSRETEGEDRLSKLARPDEGKTYCFKCEPNAARPSEFATLLFLTRKDQRTYYVSNVICHGFGERLSIREYNAILEEFAARFVQPVASQTGARVELTEAEADLEQWMSPETARKLRRFCATANKSSGSSHPTDQKRWFDFIVSAHREGADLDYSRLHQWLHESGEWDEEHSRRLASEYAFARELLAQAEKQSVGV